VQRAFVYPINNHISDKVFSSDESGRIVAVQDRHGLQFGGYRWDLFWLIPMGTTHEPRFDCEIAASGYQTTFFDVRRLFKSSHRFYNEFEKTHRTIDGKDVELSVYEQTFTLAK
jgi:hypothetical protein